MGQMLVGAMQAVLSELAKMMKLSNLRGVCVGWQLRRLLQW